MKSAFEFSVLPWPQKWRLPLLQAHRGYRPEGIQENTVKAFRLAKANGAQMIELDVRLARDGIVVVAHDADLKRVAGVDSRVADLSSADLAQYDLPTLEQVLLDRHIPALVNIEVKSEGVGSGKLEKAIAQTVRACNAQERVLFSSFNPIALGRLARHLPAVPRALLVTLADEPLNRWYLRKMVLAFLARPHMLNLDEEMYTEDLARRLKERQIPVAIWTVNEEARARNCLALGAESIISDKPRLIT
jgi:glycerophosphoryl diester phosphodiesterase